MHPIRTGEGVAQSEGKVSATFMATITATESGIPTVHTEFGAPASNDSIVREVGSALSALHLDGGRGIKFTGPMSIPVAFAVAHAVAHRYGFVACYDPKLSKFVVTISHDPSVQIGQLID